MGYIGPLTLVRSSIIPIAHYSDNPLPDTPILYR